MHSRATVGLPTPRVRRADPLHQPLVLCGSSARGARPPRVKPTRAHPVQPTHHSDRERFAVGFDELEDLALRSEVNSMAFFKISCSSFSRSYCFFIRRSAFSSAAASLSTRTPFVTTCPSRACLRQRDSMNGWM